MLSISRLMATDASAIRAGPRARRRSRPATRAVRSGGPGRGRTPTGSAPKIRSSSASSALAGGPVELHAVGEQQPGAEPVRRVRRGADRELQRVRRGDAGVAERDPGQQAAVEHPGAGLEVGAVLDRAREVARQVAGGGQRERVGEQVLADLRAAEHEVGTRLLARRHVGLDGVRERVDAGVRGDRRRRADGQQRVADRVARDQVRARDADLHLGLRVGDDRDRRRLRAGAGGGRERDQRHAPGRAPTARGSSPRARRRARAAAR